MVNPEQQPHAREVAVTAGRNVIAASARRDNYDPPPGSVYAALPAPLRRALGRTLEAAQRDETDPTGVRARSLWLFAGHALRSADTWDALDHTGPTRVCVYRRVYDRVAAIDPAIWDQVLWVGTPWLSSSLGFKVRYVDRGAVRGVYQRNFCFESRRLSWYFHPDTDCWRETPPIERVRDEPEGLHCLIGDYRASPQVVDGRMLAPADHREHDSIHIDPIDPYHYTNGDRTCRVELDEPTIAHLQQVFFPVPFVSPFEAIAPLYPPIEQAMARARATLPSRSYPGAAEDLGALEREYAALREDLADLMRHAVRGKAGWDHVERCAARLRALPGRISDVQEHLDRRDGTAGDTSE